MPPPLFDLFVREYLRFSLILSVTHCNVHAPLWRLVDPWCDDQKKFLSPLISSTRIPSFQGTGYWHQIVYTMGSPPLFDIFVRLFYTVAPTCKWLIFVPVWFDSVTLQCPCSSLKACRSFMRSSNVLVILPQIILTLSCDPRSIAAATPWFESLSFVILSFSSAVRWQFVMALIYNASMQVCSTTDFNRLFLPPFYGICWCWRSSLLAFLCSFMRTSCFLCHNPSSCPSSTCHCCWGVLILIGKLLLFNLFLKRWNEILYQSIEESVELRVSTTCSMCWNVNPTRRAFFVALLQTFLYTLAAKTMIAIGVDVRVSAVFQADGTYELFV